MKKLFLMLAILVQVSVVYSQTYFVKGFVGGGTDQMNINIISADIGGVQLGVGDEIAVFDGNLCVGAVLVEQTIIPGNEDTYPIISASSDDGAGNGFTPSHKMYFRFWDNSEGQEYHNVVPTVTDNGGVSITNAFASNGTAFVSASTAITTKTWTGADEDSPSAWTVAGNWSPAGTPEPNHDVIIPSGTPAPAISSTNSAYCGSLTFTGNPTLNIRSEISGTGSLIVSADISGAATVNARRYMTGNAWHMVSSPVSGQEFSSFLSTNSNISNNGTNNGLIKYEESLDDWTYLVTGSSSLGNGFGVRINGDGFVTYSGSLSNEDVTVSVSSSEEPGNGWNLIGNPYTSAMYVQQEVFGFLVENDAMLPESFKAIYLWDPATNVYTAVGMEEGQANLASGQGFFIKAASPGNVTFTKQMQVHETAVSFKSATISRPSIVLNAKASDITCSTKISFNEEKTLGLDPGYDLGILRNGHGFDIYSKLVNDNGVDFMVQSLPGKSTDNYIIPIGVDATKGGEIVFSASTLNLPVGYDLMIEDKLTNTVTDLDNNGIYVAELAANNKGVGRFYLHVGSSVQTAVQEIQNNELNVYTIDQTVYIKGNVSNNAQFMVYSIDGRLMNRFGAKSQNLNQFNVSGYSPGIYLIKVGDNNKYKSLKFVIGK